MNSVGSRCSGFSLSSSLPGRYIRLDEDSLVDNAASVIEAGVRDYERLP